jgi:Fe-S cluster assembly protein SufD
VVPEFLSPSAARALPGPAWLSSARAESAEYAASLTLPSPTDEEWRYTAIDKVDLGRYTHGGGTTTVTGSSSVDVTPDSWRSVFTKPWDVYSALNDAFAIPVVIHVPKGRTIAEPIVIDHAAPDSALWFVRTIVIVDDDADVTVVERFTGGVGGLIVPVLELRASRAARVRYQAVNQLADSCTSIAALAASSDRDSTTTLASIALGGGYSRVRTEARLVGQGAHGEQIGVSFGEAAQMHDLRVSQVHAAPKTTSDLSFRSAVQDEARSIYTGLIHITPDGKGSSAFQTNRIIKLSERAWADSVPNLDIENNDVKCSHASTVGPIDADQRFYLESRGIPTAVAERLIVTGFFDDVLAKMPAKHLAADLHNVVAEKLNRHAGAPS